MKQLFIVILLLATGQLTAQRNDFNPFSIESGFGLHVPLLPSEQINRSDYINVQHFHTGVRFMIFENLGLRAQYIYDRFQAESATPEGVIYHRVQGALVYNLRHMMPFLRDAERFGVLLHAGPGITFAKRMLDNADDKLLNLQIGLRPQIRLVDNVALFVDGAFVYNMKQDFHFTGQRLDEVNGSNTGLFGTFSIGLTFYLANEKGPADWQ